MSNVFISHSSHDKPFVKRLASALLSEGFPVWLDSWKLELGDSLLDKVYDGIDNSSMVVLVVSQHTVESGWVNRELNAALSKEEQAGRKFLIPVKIDNCEPPLKIADRLYADFSTSFSAPFTKLVSSLALRGCRDLIVPPEREQLSLSFTREVNLDRASFQKAIDHIKRRQGHLRLDTAQIVVNEDEKAVALLQRLHSRIDNISTDKYYSPELESGLRNRLSTLSFNDQVLAEGVSLFLANYPNMDAIYWFARILRAENLGILWNAQNPDSDVLDYGKECYSAKVVLGVARSGQINMRKVDGWQTLATKPIDQPIDLAA